MCCNGLYCAVLACTGLYLSVVGCVAVPECSWLYLVVLAVLCWLAPCTLLLIYHKAIIEAQRVCFTLGLGCQIFIFSYWCDFEYGYGGVDNQQSAEAWNCPSQKGLFTPIPSYPGKSNEHCVFCQTVPLVCIVHINSINGSAKSFCTALFSQCFRHSTTTKLQEAWIIYRIAQLCSAQASTSAPCRWNV